MKKGEGGEGTKGGMEEVKACVKEGRKGRKEGRKVEREEGMKGRRKEKIILR